MNIKVGHATMDQDRTAQGNCMVSIRCVGDEGSTFFDNLDHAWSYFADRKKAGRHVVMIDEVDGKVVKEWKP